jgi:hypothetical protein
MRRFFVSTCWVPPALWVATLLYIRPYDGWGAWAAAPLLLPSVLLSAASGMLGMILLGQTVARRQPMDRSILAATVLSGAPALYYTLRHLLRSAG